MQANQSKSTSADGTAFGDLVQAWLRKKARTEAFLNLLVSGLAFILSLLVLGFTCYVVLLPAVLFAVRLGPSSLVAGAALFLVLLFVGNARTSREYLTELPGFKWWYPLWPVGRMTTELLYSGPRMVNAAGGFFLKALRLSQLEVETCARILTILLSRPGRVSFLEMARLIPDCNPLVVIPQLRDLEGVVFLVKEPVGLSLTSDLRAELRFLMGYLPKAEPPPREEESYRLPQEPIPRNEYDILGVSPAAVLEEIKAAYRKKIKKCHPDHFVHLGKEMQCLAEEEAKVLNAAYASLSARHDRQANVSAGSHS